MFFFFNVTATTEIYTLSLHDALPILRSGRARGRGVLRTEPHARPVGPRGAARTTSVSRAPRAAPTGPSGRSEEHTLNSSHVRNSYAVFCLKKKKTQSETKRQKV